MNNGVIDQPTDSQRGRGKPSAAKSWLKAIELTSRIDADPSRLFADVVEDWAERAPDRPCLISETETFNYRTLAVRINRYARWALSAGIEKRRHGLPLDAGPPGLHRRMARHHQSRRCCRAYQYQAGWSIAVALHQRCRCRPRHPCRGSRRCVRDRHAKFEARAENLDSWRHHQPGKYRHRAGCNGGKSAVADGATRGHHRRSCTVDLHLRHHRPAQGSQHQPPAYPQLGRLVRRTDGCLNGRPVVQLPAGLSQRRRHRRTLQHVECGCLGGDR